MWVEALLLVLLLLTSAIQPRSIMQSLLALASPIQRRYTSGNNNVLFMLLRLVFQLGTLSLTLMLAVAAWMGKTAALTWNAYLAATTIVLVAMLVKGFVDKWIQLTFRFAVSEKIYYLYRNDMWQIMSLILWIILLLHPGLSNLALWIIPIVVLALYYAVLWWKIMQVFGWDISHIGYSLLYMVHVEILPLAAAVVSIGNVIK